MDGEPDAQVLQHESARVGYFRCYYGDCNDVLMLLEHDQCVGCQEELGCFPAAILLLVKVSAKHVSSLESDISVSKEGVEVNELFVK